MPFYRGSGRDRFRSGPVLVLAFRLVPVLVLAYVHETGLLPFSEYVDTDIGIKLDGFFCIKFIYEF